MKIQCELKKVEWAELPIRLVFFFRMVGAAA